MADINRVVMTGRLTKDPELRATATGTETLSLSVAVNDRVKDNQTGEWQDRPNFVDCVVFGKRAAGLSRTLSKGSGVAVEGKLRFSSWEAKDGSRRSRLEVVVDELRLMGSPSARPAEGAPAQDEAQAAYELYDADQAF